MAAGDEVIEVIVRPTDRQKAYMDAVAAAAEADEARKRSAAAVSICTVLLRAGAGNGSSNCRAPAEGQKKAGDADAEADDSDFSDVDAPQTLLSSYAVAKATEGSRPPLTAEEKAELQGARAAAKAAALLEKKAHRPRAQLLALARRMPQTLHHYVLTFIDALTAELSAVRSDNGDSMLM